MSNEEIELLKAQIDALKLELSNLKDQLRRRNVL
jgi:hypothetical protein